MNHLKSLKMEHKLYDVAHQKMGELQQLSMSWIEVRTMVQISDDTVPHQTRLPMHD